MIRANQQNGHHNGHQNGDISSSKMNLSKERLHPKRPPPLIPHSPRLIPSEHRDILSEEAFRKVLCGEMKRTVRSGSFFLLMLVDIATSSRVNSFELSPSEICHTLPSVIRETDTSGWYEQDSVLGIVFTDIRNLDGDQVQEVMRARVTAAFSAALTPEQVNHLKFLFYLFPQDWEKPTKDRSLHASLDPAWPEQEDNSELPRIAKRILDIAGSIATLILFSPLFLLISLGIKLTSRGPVLFKQERIGHRGARFTFLKFRSMKCVNDPSVHQEYVRRFISGRIHSGRGNQGVYKILEDPRVTPFGKFLRKTSLDELPQFINVLKGEMSLVGPRPPIPYEVESYQPWHLRRVFEAKPGITGLWQVNGRSSTTFDDMVRLDLRYARNWSLWLDIKILLRTPEAILSGKGAY